MEKIFNTDQISLQIDYMESINYAILLNGGKCIEDIYIRNNSGNTLNNVSVRIGGFFFPTIEVKTPDIASEETVIVSLGNVMPDLTRLLQLNEAVYAEFKVTVTSDEEEVGAFRCPITIQAWNNWVGRDMRYQELASFVMPNHPYVAHIIEKATPILQQRSRYSSFNGYSMADNREVIAQINAIWEALLTENLKYLTINPNYIDAGQRVMTPEMIALFKHGNCLDLSLLSCACLERIGLSPCLVAIPRHIVAGVWMFPDYPLSTSVAINDSEIRNCTTDENPILMLIESTAMCYGHSIDDAVSRLNQR